MNLRERFVKCFNSLAEYPNVLVFDKIMDDFKAAYSEPQRHYHNLNHVIHCLEEFDKVSNLFRDPHIIETALWYHDIVYEPRFNDNEEMSANKALFDLTRVGAQEADKKLIYNLIIATKHTEEFADLYRQTMVDVDLTILGQDEDKYDTYEFAIRKEYEWVDYKTFCTKRAKFLETLLKRNTIYMTPFFRKMYEEKAQENLRKSIKNLTDKLGGLRTFLR